MSARLFFTNTPPAIKTRPCEDIIGERQWLHRQTNGKACLERSERIERLNRTVEEKPTLVLYASSHELREALSEFRHWYNHQHYHEAIGQSAPD